VGDLPLFQVDAFSSTPFGGNPAAVVLLESAPTDPGGAGWPAAQWMQAVAAENNLAETAFLPAGADEQGVRGLRWFTPAAEVDLCGHATVAATHVLAETGQLGGDGRARFLSRSGPLGATIGTDGWIELDFPALELEPTEPPAGLLEALGVRPDAVRTVGRSRFDLLVELPDAAAVAAVQPDVAALRAVPTRGVIVTAGGGPDGAGVDFVSRFFAPAVGVDEDPVTGSAHCVLGPYWAAARGRTELRARQISARGGELRIRVGPGGRVGIAGQAVTVLRGRLCA
jgi:PhzF family phenazine biosynthesis protein